MVGGDKLDLIYLIDFGLSEKYLKEDGSHTEFKERVGLIGTARYMSINSHELNSQSRKDDLESLGYILVYLAKGKLPWMDIFSFSKKQRMFLIHQQKKATALSELCKDLPTPFLQYFIYLRQMKFITDPDYAKISNILANSNYNHAGFLFDWQVLNHHSKGAHNKRQMYQKFKTNLNEHSHKHNE